MNWKFRKTRAMGVSAEALAEARRSAVMKDMVLPRYAWATVLERITPAEIISALREYREEGKYKELSELFDLFIDADDNLQYLVDVRKEAIKRALWSFGETLPKPKQEYYDGLLERYLPGWIDVFLEQKLYGWHFVQILWALEEGKYVPAGLREYHGLDLRKVDNEIVMYHKDKPYELEEMRFVRYLYRRPKLHSILKYYVFYCFAINNWAQFTETYGKPQRVGKYEPTATAQEIAWLKQAVTALGTDQAAVVSKNTEIDFKDFTGKSESRDLYMVLCEFVSSRVTKVILGQTMTTEAAKYGTQTLGEVQAEVKEDILNADLADLRVFVNEILDRVDRINFGGGGVRVWFEAPKPVDLERRIMIDEKLVRLGVPVAVDHFYATYGVDRPGEGQVVVERFTQIDADKNADSADEKKSKTDRTEKADGADKELRMEAGALRENAPTDGDRAVPNRSSASQAVGLASCSTEANAGVGGMDRSLAQLQMEIRALPELEDLEAYIPRGFIAEYGQELGRAAVLEYVANRKRGNKTANRGLPSIEFEWDAENVRTIAALRNQAMIISGVRTRTAVEALKAEAVAAVAAGGSFADFIERAELAGYASANPYHLRTEFDNARTTAAQCGRWQQWMADKALFPYLKYVTMRDELVRAEHALLDGIVRAVDDPFWDMNYPPNGWNCRCDVEQLTEGEGEKDPGLTREDPGVEHDASFRGNVGKNGKIPGGAEADYERYADRGEGEVPADGADKNAVCADVGLATENTEGTEKREKNGELDGKVEVVKDVLNYPVLVDRDKRRADKGRQAVEMLRSASEIWQGKGVTYYLRRKGQKIGVMSVTEGKANMVVEYPVSEYMGQGRRGFQEYGV